MSLTLLLPMGLLALAGLLVPLLIHLIRRPEQEITDFAALRWLRESVRPKHRLRFDDLWLLLTRLGLVSLVALLTALPVLKGDWRTTRHVIAVDTDVDLAAARKQFGDIEADWRWIAAGFPSVEEAIPPSAQALASLLRELDSTLAQKDRLTVLVPDEVAGLDAQRIALTHAVDWQQIAAKSRALGSESGPIKRTLVIRHGPEPLSGLRYLRAAVEVWSSLGQDQWQLDDQALAMPLPEKADGLIWLGAALPDSIRTWVEKGGRVLVVDGALGQGEPVWRDEQFEIVASEERLGRGAVIHLRAPLVPARLPSMLDADFPRRLQTLILPAPRPPDRAFAREVEPSVIDRAQAEQQTSLISLMGLLMALVFLLERVLATRRKAA